MEDAGWNRNKAEPQKGWKTSFLGFSRLGEVGLEDFSKIIKSSQKFCNFKNKSNVDFWSISQKLGNSTECTPGTTRHVTYKT